MLSVLAGEVMIAEDGGVKSMATSAGSKISSNATSNQAPWHRGAPAVAISTGMIAALLIGSFVMWSIQYLPVVDNAVETSTTPHFASGFIATGILEAAALVLATTTALIAVLITTVGERAYRASTATKLLAVAAAALVAAAIPVAILYAFLAILPLFFAGVLAVITVVVTRGAGGQSEQ